MYSVLFTLLDSLITVYHPVCTYYSTSFTLSFVDCTIFYVLIHSSMPTLFDGVRYENLR